MIAAFNDAPLHLLTDEGEKELARVIAQYPRAIEAAAAAHEPHRIAFYLYDLAAEFHQLVENYIEKRFGQQAEGA